MQNVPQAKRCTRCGEMRALTEFPPVKHTSDGLCSWCRPCHRERSREYYQRAKERKLAQQQAYLASLSDEEKRRRWREYTGRWRERYPERDRAYRQQWADANRDKLREKDARRRARKLRAEGTFTEAEFQAKLERYGGRCHWCRKPIRGEPHRDHLIPLAKGGSNDISNIVPACPTCNHRKGPKMPHEFMGRLL